VQLNTTSQAGFLIGSAGIQINRRGLSFLDGTREGQQTHQNFLAPSHGVGITFSDNGSIVGRGRNTFGTRLEDFLTEIGAESENWGSRLDVQKVLNRRTSRAEKLRQVFNALSSGERKRSLGVEKIGAQSAAAELGVLSTDA
jgi:hypothetical protein